MFRLNRAEGRVENVGDVADDGDNEDAAERDNDLMEASTPPLPSVE